ncbi:MAG: LCP family protein [Patescibacteria group bacterium]|jgi:LCP family protein required for cell wall assembly
MIDFKKKIEEEDRQIRKEQGEWTESELLSNNKKRKRIVTYIIALVVIGLVFSGRVLISSQNDSSWWTDNGFFGKLKRLVPMSDKTLQGEEDDRINVLLLGMGGEGHDGAYLTDTMMLASFQPSTKKVALVSLPRDLVSPVSGWRKINSINAYAEQKEAGSGGQATSLAIGELLQVPIHYYIRADFSGFSKIIDELGGIEIEVENTFDDYSYPANGQEDNPDYYARFEHLHFDAGRQTMNGETALKYARSRHALGAEGSDFARAKRQQLVLEAIKDKLLSSRTLLNPVVITKLANEFSKNISTDLSAWEMLRFWDLFKEVDRSQIINLVLSDAPDNFLVSGKGEDGAYILTPRSGNFSGIRTVIRNIFMSDDSDVAGTTATEETKKIPMISDNASVIILNGTWITGLATRTSVELAKSKFNILKTGNAPERNYTETTLYDLGHKASGSLSILRDIVSAKIATDTPAWMTAYQTGDTNQPDFILILGTDAESAEY